MNRVKSSEKSVAMKRASSRQWVLKPQDLAIALKLVALKGQWLPYAGLGEAMHLSRFEAHAAVQRLLAARLVAAIEGPPRPVLAALRPFVIFGAPYAYPAVRGEITIGFPTAHGAAPLKDSVASTHEPPPVWPHPEGVARWPRGAIHCCMNCWPCSMDCGRGRRGNGSWRDNSLRNVCSEGGRCHG
jgi:hypothetical protein